MHLKILLVVVCLCALAIAQERPAIPTGGDSATAISLAEAEPHLIEHKPPVYPALAKAARIQGIVRLKLQLDARGIVTGVVSVDGHPMLKQAAAEAARQYRYRPFEIFGIAKGVIVEAVVEFSFSRNSAALPIPFPPVTDLGSVLIEYGDGRIHIDVSGNGLVEYNGTYGVVEGKHQTHISRQEVLALIDAFRNADFFSMLDDYSVGATDVGTTTTSIQIGNLKKAISDDWVRVPAFLKSVQEEVLRYSHSDEWTKGNADTLPALLAETADPKMRREILSNMLPRAALYGDSALVREIVSNPIDLERRGIWDGTALMNAAERGLPEMVTTLLKAGANVRARDKEGRGALIFGAGSGNARVVELLLGAGASGAEKDKYGDTALMAASAAGNPDSVRLLLKHGAQINAQNVRRQTALLSAARGEAGFAMIEMGRISAEIPEEAIHRADVVAILLNAGADINARGWFGETALFSLEDDAVQELLRHRINLETRNEYGDTALIDTVSDSIAELLIKAGANVNAESQKRKTALIEAAENNYVDKLRVLVKAPSIQLEHRNQDGLTALMAAKKAGHKDCVDVLLSAGATQ